MDSYQEKQEKRKKQMQYLSSCCDLFFEKRNHLDSANLNMQFIKNQTYKVYLIEKLLNLYEMDGHRRIYIEVTNERGEGKDLRVSKISTALSLTSAAISPSLIALTQKCITAFNSNKEIGLYEEDSLNFVSILYYYRLTEEKIKGENYERILAFPLNLENIQDFTTGILKELGGGRERIEEIEIEIEREMLNKNVEYRKRDKASNKAECENSESEIKSSGQNQLKI